MPKADYLWIGPGDGIRPTRAVRGIGQGSGIAGGATIPSVPLVESGARGSRPRGSVASAIRSPSLPGLIRRGRRSSAGVLEDVLAGERRSAAGNRLGYFLNRVRFPAAAASWWVRAFFCQTARFSASPAMRQASATRPAASAFSFSSASPAAIAS